MILKTTFARCKICGDLFSSASGVYCWVRIGTICIHWEWNKLIMAIRINASGEKMKQLTSWCLDSAVVRRSYIYPTEGNVYDIFMECGVMEFWALVHVWRGANSQISSLSWGSPILAVTSFMSNINAELMVALLLSIHSDFTLIQLPIDVI